MKKNLKRLLSMFLVVTLSIPSSMMVVNADEIKTGSSNRPVFQTNAIEYASNEAKQFEIEEEYEGLVLSYNDVDSAIDASFAGEPEALVPANKATLPSSYSSSSNIPSSVKVSKKGDYVTSVKNQGSTGTCWAHAAISMAESSYLINTGSTATKNPIDWNEYHLTYYFYHTPDDPLGLFGGDYVYNSSSQYNDLDNGGNHVYTFFTLANWIGASSNTSFDADDVLSGTGYGDTAFAFNDAGHMENAYIINMPDMNSGNYAADMNVVKQAIMEYGSVGISYLADVYIDVDGFDGYYQYVDFDYGTNHAVTVVGWNDNIDAELFPVTAPGDGAWLVKNSWGTSEGFGGYFWLSYYDETIYQNGYIFDFESGDNYDNNYQYDGGIFTYSYGSFVNEDTLTAANVFVADSKETLEAVGIHAIDVNTDYEIRIYTDLEEGANPASGTLALTQTGSTSYVGFHTVELDTPVELSEGERYAVVLTVMKEGQLVRIAGDSSFDSSWVCSRSYAKEGESYVGASVSSLEDVNEGNGEGDEGVNVRIKAFTNEAEGIVKKGSDGNWYYYKGNKIDYTYFGIAPNAKGVYYYVKNGKVNFNINGIAKCGSTSEDFYNFKNGKLVETTTIAKNSSNGNWYYVVKGKVNFKYTGVAQKSSGVWYYVAKGKVDFTFNGVAPNEKGALYYVNKGKVDFEKTGIHKRAGVYYYFKNGKVQETDTIIKHTNGNWYAVFDGIVDFTYDGIASNGKNTYYIENGKVDFTKAGIHKRSGKFYYFKAGKVQFIDSIVKNDANGNWYAIFDGVVDFTFEGIASNDRGMYYCQKGKVNFNFTGTVEYEGKTYNVVKGKATLVK